MTQAPRARIEALEHRTATAANGTHHRVVIYTGHDERGQPIPKDGASCAALAAPGRVLFLLPDNGR